MSQPTDERPTDAAGLLALLLDVRHYLDTACPPGCSHEGCGAQREEMSALRASLLARIAKATRP